MITIILRDPRLSPTGTPLAGGGGMSLPYNGNHNIPK